MNTAFNSALKQSTALRKDLAGLTDINELSTSTQPTPATLGSLSASLATFSRALDEYTTLAKQELNSTKQEKAFDRIRNFRSELSDFRSTLDRLKAAREDTLHAQHRSELLGRRPYATSTPENPYASTGSPVPGSHSFGTSISYGISSPSGTGPSSNMGSGISGLDAREAHVLHEQSFFANTNSALDEYIARGQAVLGDLGTQREMLKNTQRRLYSVANTLGVSGDSIRMVERRARQGKWIFWGGAMVFFTFCWLCLHYLR